ncbi:MAG: DEAD/DEAH box helicase [Rikenellaceae bacterium]
MNFESLGVDPNIVSTLHGLGIVSPTPIQQRVIPEALARKSIVARSQTGSGKTLAYVVPIVQNLADSERALILSPTRELVQQIGEVCAKVSDKRCVTIYGGVEYATQREELSEGFDIMVSTVGRLIDLIGQGVVDISGIEIFVLDEVDQMLDLGFRDDIIHLASLRSQNSQTLCYSATLPEAVESVVVEIMPQGYIRVDNSDESLAVERIEQVGYYVTMEMMDHLLLHLLRTRPPQRGIIFCRSRKMADRLSLLLRDNEIFAEAMHSDRSQSAREHILSRFKSGETKLIVATDVIARGIDVDDVDVVYNYGLPLEAEQYVHRIGRTARAGRIGQAMTLCAPAEKHMVDKVCKLMRRHIVMSASHPYATPEILRTLSASDSSTSVRPKTKRKTNKKR